MIFEQWMRAAALTDRDVASRLSQIMGAPVDRTTIGRYRRRQRVPTVEHMRAIYVLTRGEVTANDWVHRDQGGASCQQDTLDTPHDYPPLAMSG